MFEVYNINIYYWSNSIKCVKKMLFVAIVRLYQFKDNIPPSFGKGTRPESFSDTIQSLR